MPLSRSHMTKALGAVALLLILPSVACYTFAGAAQHATDDVFILLVYVRHFLEGGGYYWNAQDGPIDGFTSLLDLWSKRGLGLSSVTSCWPLSSGRFCPL